jgi:hypothetical protein
MNLLFVFLSLFPLNLLAIGNRDTGYQVPNLTTVRINEHGICKKVNNGTASYNFFVGAKSSTEWSVFQSNYPAGVTLSNCDATFKSCLDILKANPGAATGKYTIDPDGENNGEPAIDTFCDMTTDGGGWTLVWSNTRGGSNKAITGMTWEAAVKTTPLCSQAGGSGTGCNPYLTWGAEGFNYFIGLNWWSKITNQNKNVEMLYNWASDFGQPIQQSAKWNLKRINASQLYILKASNYTQLVGGTTAGLLSYHMGNQFPFSTIDRDNSPRITEPCASLYSNSPFWYGNCWNGTIHGQGEFAGAHFNGAYWSGADAMWGQSAGIGAGNGWIYVREYSYLANCTEIKSKFPQAPDGLYWIDPDGVNGNAPLLAQCDMTTDGGGWTLVLNQKSDTGGFFADSMEAITYNVSNAKADRYSILSRLEEFRSLKGTFTFRINAPVTGKRNIWQQRTNPAVDQPVAGYVPISLDSTSDYWGGLERNCALSCFSSLIDGSVNHTDWWYAIGSYYLYGSIGIPGLNNLATTHMQLWTRDDSFLVTSPRDCQDILEYGQANGNGLYWVDPLQNGSSQQVYCDMMTDGGGWTKIFNHNIVDGYFANSTDVLSKNVANPNANLYSILNQLDEFKANNRYIFRINWPGYVQRNIWMQSSSPLISQPVAGYVPLSIDTSSQGWGGIERDCGVGCANTFMDGTIGTTNYFYAIGQYAVWTGGIPASYEVSMSGVQQVQLWTRRAEGQFTKRSCKEILNAKLSTGSGQYYIDPDGVGGEPPFRTWCDMVTDGGGWTRVAVSAGAVTNAQVPSNFFATKINPKYAGLAQTAGYAGSIDAEWFSKVIGTTDAMLVAPSYPGSPYIDNSMGLWQYDTPRCAGVLFHTSRTAGCPGQAANDGYAAEDSFNVAIEGGAQAIVPSYKNMAYELCYPGRGDCQLEFYLR